MDIIQPVITAIYFVFGGVLLFLAYNIVRDNLSNRQNKIAGMMLFFAALGPILLALGEIVRPNMAADAPFEESVAYNFHYIWELFYPAFLLFSWVFPRGAVSTRLGGESDSEEMCFVSRELITIGTNSLVWLLRFIIL